MPVSRGATVPSKHVLATTMELALATANYLSPIADALVYINTTKVHPVLFPYPIAPTLHAARISIIYQSNARRSPSTLSWGTYITGYLIMVCLLRPSSIVLVRIQRRVFYSVGAAVSFHISSLGSRHPCSIHSAQL